MRVLLPCTGCAIAFVCTRLATDCRYHTCIKGYVERMSGSDEKYREKEVRRESQLAVESLYVPAAVGY